MIPRDPMCDNDDCYEEPDENGNPYWVHVEECDAEDYPPMTEERAQELIRNAPEGSFLATTFGPALRKAARK